MIGDVLTSTILFEALRERFPEAELHYLIHRHTFPVQENNPNIDKTILFDPEIHHKPFAFWKLSRQIRKQHYDIVIDVYAKINSAVLTFLSKANQRISYHKWYTFRFYNQTAIPKKESKTQVGLAIENRLLLLQKVMENAPTALKPKLYLTEKEKQHAQEYLNNAGISKEKPLLMIGVLGSTPSKTYPLKYMASLLDFIVSQAPQAQMFFNYIPAQKEQVTQIVNSCKPATQKQIFINLYGKSLREFIALTSYCDALIGNEGGAINMAKALDIPTFAIFSPQIKKKNWAIYEDGIQNISVHIRDFLDTEIENLKSKDSEKINELYLKFQPEFIFDQLKQFLQLNKII